MESKSKKSKFGPGLALALAACGFAGAVWADYPTVRSDPGYGQGSHPGHAQGFGGRDSDRSASARRSLMEEGRWREQAASRIDRIGRSLSSGKADGSLTREERSYVRKLLDRLNERIGRDRSDDGRFDAKERARIDRELDKIERRVESERFDSDRSGGRRSGSHR